MATCSIPYIDNSGIPDSEKEAKKELHLKALRELFSFDKFKLTELSRKASIGDKMIKYFIYPSGQRGVDFAEFVKGTTYLKQFIEKKDLGNGKQALLIDVFGDTDIEDIDFLNLGEQEFLLRHGQTIHDSREDLTSILEDPDSRNAIGEILFKELDRINILLSNPKISDSFKNQLLVLKNGLQTEDFVYSVEAASNFVKYSINYSKYAVKKFQGKDSVLEKLKEIETLSSFEERKAARGKLSREVDYIKNKFYIFEKLKDVADELAINSDETDSVFDIYNRYKIQAKLEELTQDAEKLERIEKLIAGHYNSDLELIEQIEEVDLGLTKKQIRDIFGESVYETMKNEDGTVKKSLLRQVRDSIQEMNTIADGIRNYMEDAQVDLLFDTYNTYTPQNETTYQKAYGITKQRIRNSIRMSNGSIGLLSYGLKHGDQLPDETISLFTTLLKQTLMEKDFEDFQKMQHLRAKFAKYDGYEEEYSRAMQTYTFDIVNKAYPQFYTKIIEDGVTYLAYDHTFKNAEGLIDKEARKFEIPTESVYGRYFKLSDTNDDNWAYLTDSGFYVRVQATKALVGRNKEHRINIERHVLNAKLNEIAEDVITNDTSFELFPEGNGLKATTFTKSKGNNTHTIKSLKYAINDAFNLKYYEKQSRAEEADKTKDIYEELQKLSGEDREKLLRKHFKKKVFSKYSNMFFTNTTDEQKANDTFLAAINHEIRNIENTKYLIQLEDNSIIPVSVTRKDDVNTIYHEGNIINTEDIKYFFTKGDSYTSLKEDDVIVEQDFERKRLSDPLFASFYKDIVEEYDLLVDADVTGFLKDGKVGQVAASTEKSTLQHLKEIKGAKDIYDKSVEGLNDFIGEDKNEYVDKVNRRGEYIDHNGEVLKQGQKLIKVKKSSLNIDRLDVDDFMPPYSKRKYNQDFLVTDLISNITTMFGESNNLKKMYDLEPQFRNALILAKGSAELNIGARGSSDIVKSKRGLDLQNKESKQAFKTLEFFIKAYGYNSPEVTDCLGRGTIFERIVKPIRKLTFFQTLALNVRSAFFSNLPIGQINNLLVARSNRFGLDQEVVLSGMKTTVKNLGEILAGTVGHVSIADSHYLVKLASTFNAISGFGVDPKTYNQESDAINHYASYKSLFLMQAGTEVANQLPLMLGFMKKHEISPGWTMYDAIKVGGKKLNENPPADGFITFTYEDGSPITARDVSIFSNRLNDLNSEAQGDYGTFQKVRFRHELIPGLALTFAGWLYPNLRKRFSTGKQFDLKTGKQDFGGYQLKFIENTFGALKEYSELFTFGPEENLADFLKSPRGLNNIKEAGKKAGLGVLKTFGALPLNVLNTISGFKLQEGEQFRKFLQIKEKDSEEFKDMFNLKQLEEETQEEFDKRMSEAYEFYTDALKAASTEYTALAALMIIGLMLHAMADMDDDGDSEGAERLAQFLEIQSRQLVSDLSLGAPLLNPIKGYDFFNQRAKDPLVIYRTIQTTSKLILNIVGFETNLAKGQINFKINDTYDKSGPGYEKGDLKLGKNFEKAFGPYHQIAKLFNVEGQGSYLKMINQGAIFSDDDLSEK